MAYEDLQLVHHVIQGNDEQTSFQALVVPRRAPQRPPIILHVPEALQVNELEDAIVVVDRAVR